MSRRFLCAWDACAKWRMLTWFEMLLRPVGEFRRASDRRSQLIRCIEIIVIGLLGGTACEEFLSIVVMQPDLQLSVGIWLLAATPMARSVPLLIRQAGEHAVERYAGFFTTNLTNPHTRRAYARACRAFLQWCEQRGLRIETIEPHDVSLYVETLGGEVVAQSVRQALAAIRMMLDWLLAERVIATNPAVSVRGPKALPEAGEVFVLAAAEWRLLVDAIPTALPRDLRDRALIATLTYTFARISTALALRVGDFRANGPEWELWLHRRQGGRHPVPCHRELAEALESYIVAAGLAADFAGHLFRTSRGRSGDTLSALPMTQADAWRMIRRRALAAGIEAPIGCHTFRATGIATYLANGGTLTNAQSLAGHKKSAVDAAV